MSVNTIVPSELVETSYDHRRRQRENVSIDLQPTTFRRIEVPIIPNILNDNNDQTDMIGIIAANAAGIPLTEMNLCSFHHNVNINRNVTEENLRMRNVFNNASRLFGA